VMGRVVALERDSLAVSSPFAALCIGRLFISYRLSYLVSPITAGLAP
jgi:hypothetical protein